MLAELLGGSGTSRDVADLATTVRARRGLLAQVRTVDGAL
jgi:hypothetical protein